MRNSDTFVLRTTRHTFCFGTYLYMFTVRAGKEEAGVVVVAMTHQAAVSSVSHSRAAEEMTKCERCFDQ